MLHKSIATAVAFTLGCAPTTSASLERRGETSEPPVDGAASARPSNEPSDGTVGRPASAGAPDRGVDEAEFERLWSVLRPGEARTSSPCDDSRCLAIERFRGKAEQEDVLALYEAFGDVVTVEPATTMDGGFRGTIALVPEWPVGKHRVHLGRILRAQRHFHEWLEEAEKDAGRPFRYRHRNLVWSFFRSVGRTTPSAYASGWKVAYNVSGSLMQTDESVEETIIHEVFHLNDQQHGDWSRGALGDIVRGILARCGTSTPCLARYAPGKTQVRGGTFYAFQPNNGEVAHEYAAELALRFVEEQRAAYAGETRVWFKCKAPENEAAMKLLIDEFFAGYDRTPPCGT